MYGLHLAADLHFHIRSSHHDFNVLLLSERSRHFHVASAFADIGESAAVGDIAAQAIDFRAQLAGESALSATVAAELKFLALPLWEAIRRRNGRHGTNGRGVLILRL